MEWIAGIVAGKVVPMRAFSIAIAALLVLMTSANAEYVGKLKFKPRGCERAQKCYLVYDFGYIDRKGQGWVASAGEETDGASIPRWAQLFIGPPFHKSFIKAAVIHDHYCKRHVRRESRTHRVFYESLRESGVQALKAKLMYYAVVVGATHWSKLIPGEKCSVGANCIKNTGIFPNLHGGSIVAGRNGTKYLVKRESFDRPGFTDELKSVERILNTRGNKMSLGDLDALARERHPGDFFINTGDTLQLVERAPGGTLK